MRKLSFLSILLVVGLVVGSLSMSFAYVTEAANGNSQVTWNNGSSCRIIFNGLDSPELTDGTSEPPYESGKVLDSTENRMNVITNCPNGVSVDLQATSVSTPTGFPSGASLLDDFQWQISSASTGRPFSSFTVSMSGYNSFSSLDSNNTVGSSGGPGVFQFSADYKYTIDNQDVPGNYSITLQYTVTSN